MYEKLWHYIASSGLRITMIGLWTLCSCANPSLPSGGPIDRTPPKLDTLSSSPMFLTNSYPKEIKLSFDEWVVLQQASKEIIISPELKYPPDIKLKGKSLILSFDRREILRPQTTYVINFGKSIKDLNESNPFPNYQYIFSTGDVIDQNQIKGLVKNAYTGQAEKDIIVALYTSAEDSIIYKSRPDYYTLTDASGRFHISYLPKDTFQIFALQDNNRNYYFDQLGEQLAFYPQTITTSDTIQNYVELSLYQPRFPFFLNSHNDDTLGQLFIDYLGSSDSLRMIIEPKPDFLIQKLNPQNIQLFFSPTDKKYKIELLRPDQVDTLDYQPSPKKIDQKLKLINLNKNKIFTQPNGLLPLRFNIPVTSIDTTKCYYSDTLGTYPCTRARTKDSLLMHWSLMVNPTKSKATMYLLPDAITDYRDSTNPDTITFAYQVKDPETLGNITLKIRQLDPSKQYLLWIDAPKYRELRKIHHDSIYHAELTLYPPAKYRFTIIEDRNQNGRWDGGQHLKKIPPERLMITEEKELRANWDLSIEIVWKQ